MATRTNLCVNPGLKNDNFDWFGPSGWVRTTTGNAALPRTTAYAGSAAGNVVGPRFNVTPSQTVVVSAHVLTTVSQSFSVGLDYYNSGTYVSSSASTVYSPGAGVVTRVSSGPLVIPAGVNEGVMFFFGVDGAARITGVLYEVGSTLGSYFDGDTPGATWDGTNGGSTSTLIDTTIVPKSGTDSFALTELATRTIGPSYTESVALAETMSVLAQPTGSDSFSLSELPLLVTVTYDDKRGRVRIDASGFSPSVTRAVVYSKAANKHSFTEVRGGRVSVSGGDMSRPVDDYEFAANIATTYKVVGLSSPENAPDVIVQSAMMTRVDDLDHVWLKFIAAPYLNRKVTLTGWGAINRDSRNTAFEIVGRSEPVVVTDVHSSRSTTVNLLSTRVDETVALDLALSQGVPVFLHVPTHCQLPSMYATIGNYSYSRPTMRSERAWFEVDVTEVAPPPPSVVGRANTWQILMNQHLTWQEVLDTYATWQELVD